MNITEVVLATRNKDKITEIKQILSDLNIRILTFMDFKDFPIVKEDGKTLEENAIKKAKQICLFTNRFSLADDSGLEVDILKGKPGVLSSRFSGEGASYNDNNNKLLRLLKTVPFKERKAKFHCVAVLFSPQGEYWIQHGILEGYIAMKKVGDFGFGYDPLFFLPSYNKTVAQFNLNEKNKISHRAIAFRKIKDIIKV